QLTDRGSILNRRIWSTFHASPTAADDLTTCAHSLLASEQNEVSLRIRLTQAQQVIDTAECYLAAAVQDARRAGTSWAVIADAARVSESSAQQRWSDLKVGRLLAARLPAFPTAADPASPLGASAPIASTSCPQSRTGHKAGAARRLSRALSVLYTQAGASLEALAAEAGIPARELALILNGRRTPSWPVTFVLTSLLNGPLEDLKNLWELAQRPPSRPSLTAGEAAACLHNALRGLYLAAGEPSLAALCEGGALPARMVNAVLSGIHTPDWPTTYRLTALLGADPAIMETYWQLLDYAHLAAQRDAAGAEGDEPK
ncbi:hypothetical protein, partial [Streptomyces candidus]